MPRPRKGRKVCCLPLFDQYGPLNRGSVDGSIVMMSVDEYETIRLIDYEGLEQEESARMMNVARSTVQAIYQSARQKIADALINGSILRIEGGDYEFYNEQERLRGCGRHRGHRHGMHR
jgi:predicted DNA-binding protein (UPF0251 family)